MSQPDLAPWLEFHCPRRRAWFAAIFDLLNEQGWKLDDCHPSDGNPLVWNIRDSRIIASRTVSTPVFGSCPGIELSDDLHDWEAVITTNTPLEVVRAAINALNPNED